MVHCHEVSSSLLGDILYSLYLAINVMCYIMYIVMNYYMFFLFIRLECHFMMSLCHGQLTESTARLGLTRELVKVSWVVMVTLVALSW